MGWGQAIGAGIDAIKSNKQQSAANDAAAAQINAANAGLQFDLAQYNQGRQDNLNALVTGNSAWNALAKLYGLDSYTGQVNTNPITMTGGVATATNDAPWYDPGGLFPGKGASLSTTPITFDTGQSSGGVSTGSTGGTATGSGQMDFSSFYNSPDYQFALQQGTQGQDRSAAARGRLYSGGYATDLAKYQQGLASQQLGTYTNNLMRLAGLGSSTAGTTASLGQSTANSVSQQLTNAGNARASGYTNSANAQNDMLSNWGNRLADWYGNQQGSSTSGYTSSGATDWGAFSPYNSTNNYGSGWNFG